MTVDRDQWRSCHFLLNQWLKKSVYSVTLFGVLDNDRRFTPNPPYISILCFTVQLEKKTTPTKVCLLLNAERRIIFGAFACSGLDKWTPSGYAASLPVVRDNRMANVAIIDISRCFYQLVRDTDPRKSYVRWSGRLMVHGFIFVSFV